MGSGHSQPVWRILDRAKTGIGGDNPRGVFSTDEPLLLDEGQLRDAVKSGR